MWAVHRLIGMECNTKWDIGMCICMHCGIYWEPLMICVCVCVCVCGCALKRIRKDHKKYNSIFESKDHATKNRASKELLEKRRGLMDSFLMYRKRRQAALQEMKKQFEESKCLKLLRTSVMISQLV